MSEIEIFRQGHWEYDTRGGMYAEEDILPNSVGPHYLRHLCHPTEQKQRSQPEGSGSMQIFGRWNNHS